MDWSEMITNIFQVCLIPLLGILTKYLIAFINIKSKELQDKTDNEKAQKYMQMATETITSCVIATNQTYVESLKAQGKFDKEAQEIAFNKTLEAVLTLLNDEVKDYITEAFGDLNAYLNTQIEAAVNGTKNKPPGERNLTRGLFLRLIENFLVILYQVPCRFRTKKEKDWDLIPNIQ